MEKLFSIETTYIETSRSEKSRNLYVQFKPPVGTQVKTEKYNILIVVDCSGSMSGSRIGKVNAILRDIYSSEKTISIEIIRFGSQAQGPNTYVRGKSELPTINADLGGTDFNKAMELLQKTLKSKSKDGNLFVIFLSDGEGSHPSSYYKPVSQELKRLDAPLLSLAISSDVNPEIMANLANLNGDLGLCLIKDQSSDEEGITVISEFIPFGNQIDELIITLKNASGEILNTRHLKYSRGVDILSTEIKDLSLADQCLITGELEGQVYTLDLKNFETGLSLEQICEFVSNYVFSHSKAVMGDYLTKKISAEEAKNKVTELRDLFLQKVNENGHIDDILSKYANNKDLIPTPEDKQKLRNLKQLHKTSINNTRTHINRCLDVLMTNDLRGALEAYSGKAVSMKFNARIQQIALKNQQKTLEGISDKFVEAYLATDNKPFAQCVYWLQNPLECEKNEMSSLDRGEWVGNGLLAQPGVSAALSPWNIDNVVFRPVVITNTTVSLLKLNQNDPRNKALLKGFEGEFNTSIPLISPEEHQGAVRLNLEFMRKTLPGQQQISKIFSNTTDLYDNAMVNALYVAATLDTLKHAHINLDFILAFRSFLTLADQLYTKSPLHEPASDFWENFLDNLLDKSEGETAQANNIEKESLKGIYLISNREPFNLPNISRAFISLTCCDKAYTSDFEEIKRVFRLLFARLIVEQSSQKYQFSKLVGVSKEDLSSQVSELIAQSVNGHNIQIPKIQMGENKEEIKIIWKKFAYIFEIHCAIRNYLNSNNLKFSEFTQQILIGKLSLEVGKELFQDVQSEINKGFEKLLATLFDEANAQKVVRLLLIKACENHTQASLPNHDSSDIKRVLSSFETIDELEKEIERIFNRYIKSIFAGACSDASQLIKRKKQSLKYIERAREFNRKFPLEALEFEFQHQSLAYSTEHRVFPNRDKMFNFLTLFSIDEHALCELENQPIQFFNDFDLVKWILAHRNYLHGFSLFYKNNIQASSSKEEFIQKMEVDLAAHYEGGDGKTQREFTPVMRAFLPRFAGHFWDERELMNQIQNLKDQGLPTNDIISHISNNSSEIKQLSGEQLEVRLRHVNHLVNKIVSS